MARGVANVARSQALDGVPMHSTALRFRAQARGLTLGVANVEPVQQDATVSGPACVATPQSSDGRGRLPGSEFLPLLNGASPLQAFRSIDRQFQIAASEISQVFGQRYVLTHPGAIHWYNIVFSSAYYAVLRASF